MDSRNSRKTEGVQLRGPTSRRGEPTLRKALALWLRQPNLQKPKRKSCFRYGDFSTNFTIRNALLPRVDRALACNPLGHGVGVSCPALLLGTSIETSLHRNHVNLNQGITRQFRHLHGRAGRRELAEVAAVFLVHGAEIVHVFQKYAAPHHLVQGRSRRLEDGLDVVQHPPSLGLDVLSDHLAGPWIERNLTGQKDQPIYLDRLRVRADGLRCRVAIYYFSYHSSPL